MNAENQDERIALTAVVAIVGVLLIGTVVYAIHSAGGPSTPRPATAQIEPASSAGPLALGTVELAGTPANIAISGKVPDEATRERLLKPARVLWGKDNVEDKLMVDPNAPPLAWHSPPLDVMARMRQLPSFDLRTDKDTLQLKGAAPQAVITTTENSLPMWFSDNANATVDLTVMQMADALPPSDSLLDERIEFATGQAALPEGCKARLTEIASLLKDDDRVIIITGHTDDQGDDTNVPLSQARAESVRAFLTTQGVPGHRLAANGAGATQPVADNATEGGRQRNRRIAFSVQAR
jgi:OOP family OmpA-OmpF porin